MSKISRRHRKRRFKIFNFYYTFSRCTRLFDTGKYVPQPILNVYALYRIIRSITDQHRICPPYNIIIDESI